MFKFEMLRGMTYANRTSKYFWNTTMGICILVGLFVPEKVLTEYPWARQFSDFMAAWIPHIDRISAVPIKVEINRFYYSFLWAYTLLIFMPFYVYERVEQYRNSDKQLLATLKWGNLLVVFILGGALCVAFYYDMTDYPHYLSTHNKLFYWAYAHWLIRPLWSLSGVFFMCFVSVEVFMRIIHLIFIQNHQRNRRG